MADCEVTARACFVRTGLDPDEYQELLGAVRTEMEEIAEGFRDAGRCESEARIAELEADLARKDAALGAAYSATEPIAIADEHDVVSEDGYTSINKNTRKAIINARALIREAKGEPE